MANPTLTGRVATSGKGASRIVTVGDAMALSWLNGVLEGMKGERVTITVEKTTEEDG